jgi:pantoate--beta-alanine ligase
VFAPSSDVMYSPGTTTQVVPHQVATRLEGECRPEHFGGVATIVLKLFLIIPAHVAFFGQKDYQQTLVVRRMVDDLNIPIEIDVQPTVRETDGLALSSRNAFLSADQRQRALGLSQALQSVQDLFKGGETNADVVRDAMRKQLADAGVDEIEYVSIADPETLAELQTLDGAAVALVAARVGKTRLIDNMRFG